MRASWRISSASAQDVKLSSIRTRGGYTPNGLQFSPVLRVENQSGREGLNTPRCRYIHPDG